LVDPLGTSGATLKVGRFKELGRRYYRQMQEGKMLRILKQLVFDDVVPALEGTVAGVVAIAAFGTEA
jgi:hypothetical protein